MVSLCDTILFRGFRNGVFSFDFVVGTKVRENFVSILGSIVGPKYTWHTAFSDVLFELLQNLIFVTHELHTSMRTVFVIEGDEVSKHIFTRWSDWSDNNAENPFTSFRSFIFILFLGQAFWLFQLSSMFHIFNLPLSTF